MAIVPSDMVAQDQLKAYVRRIEALDDEIKVLNEDKSEVYKEAKGNGFDTKIVRKVIAARRQGAAERAEQDALFQLYWDAIHGVAHAHVEIIEEFPPHDADGVVLEDIAGNGAGGAGDDAQVATERAPSSAQPIIETHERASTNDEPSPEAGPQAQAFHSQGTGAGTLADREARFDGEAVPAVLPTHSAPRKDTDQGASEGSEPPASLAISSQAKASAGNAITAKDRAEVGTDGSGEASRLSAGSGTVATNSEPAAPPSEIAEPGDRSAVIPAAAPVVAGNVMVFRTHDPETHFLNSEGLSRLHGCLKPELCGSSEPRKRLCFNCSLQHDGPTHQAEAG